MGQEKRLVGVVVERVRLDNPWVDHTWVPVAILPGAPDTPDWTVLEETPERTRYYAGTSELGFYRTETTYYRDNLSSGAPKIWVALRPGEASPGVSVLMVTADPAEGEALTEPGTDIVEPVPMPADIAAALASFVAEHHVERVFYKRQRDRQDPEALGRRGPRRDEDEE